MSYLIITERRWDFPRIEGKPDPEQSDQCGEDAQGNDEAVHVFFRGGDYGAACAAAYGSGRFTATR